MRYVEHSGSIYIVEGKLITQTQDYEGNSIFIQVGETVDTDSVKYMRLTSV